MPDSNDDAIDMPTGNDVGEGDEPEPAPVLDPAVQGAAARTANGHGPTGPRKGSTTHRKSRDPEKTATATGVPTHPRNERIDGERVPSMNMEVGAGKNRWKSRDADELWGEVLEWLEREGISVYEVSVQVIRLVPPPKQQVGAQFDAQLIKPDGRESPSDKLVEFVKKYYHLPIATGPIHYEIRFIRKRTSKTLAFGDLQLGDPQEELALRQAQMHQQRLGRPPMGGFVEGPPPQFPDENFLPPAPRTYGGAPPGFGNPYLQPPQAPQGESYEVQRLREQLARAEGNAQRLESQNSEMFQAYREGRPLPDPTRVPGSPPNAAEIAAGVVQALIAAGVIAKPAAVGVGAAPVAAAPAAPPPVDQVAQAQAGISNLRSLFAVAKELKGLGGMFGTVFGGGDASGGDAIAAEPVDTAEEALPFSLNALPDTKWGNGTPVNIPVNRATGEVEWDPKVILMSNPKLAEDIIGVGNRIAETVMSYARSVPQVEAAPTQTQQAQVVDNIPANAAPANARPAPPPPPKRTFTDPSK
jgi:hypothetical protein